MYSRYSGFSIPKNYGGSRFSKVSEPETKAHRGEIGGASRSAHSPSFQGASQAPEILEDRVDDLKEHDELGDDNIMEFDDIKDNECKESEPTIKAYDEVKKRPPSPLPFELSSVKDLFSHIDKEEPIIIGLILLLMSDSSQKNDDIVAILILLLFNGKI